MITGNLNVIPDARVRNNISKGPKSNYPLILISLDIVKILLLLLMTLVIVGAKGKMLNPMP